jgi:hypothetical protein
VLEFVLATLVSYTWGWMSAILQASAGGAARPATCSSRCQLMQAVDMKPFYAKKNVGVLHADQL